MDFERVVKMLIADGLSEDKVAIRVSAVLGRKITQPTIHRIKKGTEPRWHVGQALLAVKEERAA